MAAATPCKERKKSTVVVSNLTIRSERFMKKRTESPCLVLSLPHYLSWCCGERERALTPKSPQYTANSVGCGVDPAYGNGLGVSSILRCSTADIDHKDPLTEDLDS